MSLFRRESKAMRALVVARARTTVELEELGRGTDGSAAGGDVAALDALRVETAENGARLVPVRAATIPWHSGAALGEPLEERLGWHADEPVILAPVTPMLVGNTWELPDDEPGLGTDTRTSPSADAREVALRARWEGHERIRDRAQTFFACALEDIEVIADAVTFLPAGGETLTQTLVTCLASGPGISPATLVSPPDIPHLERVLLPIALGGCVRGMRDRVGLLLLEEQALTAMIWEDDVLRLARTLPLGAADLLACLVRALPCSPRDARALLDRADHGTLEAESLRLLARTLRSLLPLFRGAWRMVGADVPEALRPRRVFVAGFWPSIVLRVFCRTALRATWMHPAAAPRILPLASVTSSVTPLQTTVPAVHLLEQCAAAVLEHQRVVTP